MKPGIRSPFLAFWSPARLSPSSTSASSAIDAVASRLRHPSGFPSISAVPTAPILRFLGCLGGHARDVDQDGRFARWVDVRLEVAPTPGKGPRRSWVQCVTNLA